LTLTPIATGLWAAERPFTWNGIDVGGRAVIARMPSEREGELGGLLVHSPVQWEPELDDSLKRLGGQGVQALVSPNYEHLKYIKQWSDKYPESKKLACPGLKYRMPEISWTHEFGDENNDCPNGFEYIWFDCEVNPFTGKPFFNEVVFFHRQSKAVFMADTFWNYPSTDLPNYFNIEGTGAVHKCPKVGEIKEDLVPSVSFPFGSRMWKVGMDKIYLPFYKQFMVGHKGARREKYNMCVEKLLSWQAELIVPCHGDVVRGKSLCDQVLRTHFLS